MGETNWVHPLKKDAEGRIDGMFPMWTPAHPDSLGRETPASGNDSKEVCDE
jgi:hypothetical protein